MATSHGKEICNTAMKTTVVCKKEVKQTVLSSVAFGQLYQQEITLKHGESKDFSVLRRRWIGYRLNDSNEYNSPSVFLKYDEIMYPISKRCMPKQTPMCMITSSAHNSQEPERKWCSWRIVLIICFILSAVLVSSYLQLQNTCNKVFDTDKFKDILDENVFGQDEIKEQLMRTIQNMNLPVDSDLKFLVFSGSSGIGKTYVASLIAQFFPWPENVQLLMAPVHSEVSASDIHKHISPCGYNLVIIDDLKESDVNMILELKRYYEGMNRQFIKIIFIFIFSIGQNVSVSGTGNSFSKTLEGSSLMLDQSVTHFHFKQLEENDILEFIQKSFYKRGVTEPQIFIKDFISNFLGPSFPEGGCKRISSKLALFLEMYEQKKLRANLE